ncbi:c-type cytochrome [Pusillimonas sp. ANT_WB101]|uniref:c-type cytochrome n=1 Tax=Pusillimonas sp. ANT_WB101 TaxID=2597356 RepID=UPI0011EFFB13|nr:c-type cytochrome [Pusillimonas sp. ANT_WB101]KAA0890613.1 c-type cytochrome [Pusillimonas sp. ANT_WB101]
MAYNISLRHGLSSLSFAIGAVVLVAPAMADIVSDGQTIATSGVKGVVACATCHGAKGEGMAAAGFPYLAGQGAAYLMLQLQGFANGTRHNPIMEPIAKALSPVQIAAVTAYFSQLPKILDAKALSAQAPTYPDKDAMGAWVANRGDWDNNIPACAQCHGPGGIGIGQNFPALAGLPATYIREQLNAWQQEKRAPGPLSLMGDIASRMSEAQITAVADYFSGLPEAVKSAAPASAPASQGAQ